MYVQTGCHDFSSSTSSGHNFFATIEMVSIQRWAAEERRNDCFCLFFKKSLYFFLRNLPTLYACSMPACAQVRNVTLSHVLKKKHNIIMITSVSCDQPFGKRVVSLANGSNGYVISDGARMPCLIN